MNTIDIVSDSKFENFLSDESIAHDVENLIIGDQIHDLKLRQIETSSLLDFISIQTDRLREKLTDMFDQDIDTTNFIYNCEFDVKKLYELINNGGLDNEIEPTCGQNKMNIKIQSNLKTINESKCQLENEDESVNLNKNNCELEILREENMKLNGKVEELNKKDSNQTSKIKELEEKVTKLVNQHDELLSSLELSNCSLKDKINVLENELQTLKTESQVYINKNNDISVKVTSLQFENDNLKQLLSEKELKYQEICSNDKDEEIKILNERNFKLNEDLEQQLEDMVECAGRSECFEKEIGECKNLLFKLYPNIISREDSESKDLIGLLKLYLNNQTIETQSKTSENLDNSLLDLEDMKSESLLECVDVRMRNTSTMQVIGHSEVPLQQNQSNEIQFSTEEIKSDLVAKFVEDINKLDWEEQDNQTSITRQTFQIFANRITQNQLDREIIYDLIIEFGKLMCNKIFDNLLDLNSTRLFEDLEKHIDNVGAGKNVEDYQNIIRNLENVIGEQNTTIKECECIIENLTNEKGNISESVEMKIEEIKIYKEQNIQLQAQIEQLKSCNWSLNDDDAKKISQLMTEIKDIKQEYINFKSEAKDREESDDEERKLLQDIKLHLEEELKELQSNMDANKIIMVSKDEEIIHLKNSIETNKISIVSKEEEIINLKERIEEYKTSMEVNKITIVSKEEEIIHLKEQIKEYKTSIEVNKITIVSKEEEIIHLKEQIEEYKNSVEANKITVLNKEEIIINLNRNVEECESNIINLKSSLDAAKETLRVTEEKYQPQIDGLENQLKSVQLELETIMALEKQSAAKVDSLQSSLELINKELESKDNKLTEMEKNIVNHLEKIELYESSMDELKYEIQDRQLANDNLKKQLDDAVERERKSVELSESEIKSFKYEMVELNNIIDSEKNNVINLTDQLEMAHNELNIKINLLKQHEDDIEKYIFKFNEMSQELGAREELITDKNKMIEKKNNDLKELNDELVNQKSVLQVNEDKFQQMQLEFANELEEKAAEIYSSKEALAELERSLKEQVAGANERVLILSKEVEKKMDELYKVKQELKTTIQLLDEKESVIAEQIKEVVEFKDRIERDDVEINELRESNSRLMNKLKVFENSHDYKVKNEELIQLVAKLQSELSESQNLLKQKQNELDQCNNTLLDSNLKLEKMDKQIKELKCTRTSIDAENELKSLQEKLMEARRYESRVKEYQNQADNAKSKLVEKVTEMNKKFEKYERKIYELENNCDNNSVLKLTKQLEQSHKKEIELQQITGQLKQEISVLKSSGNGSQSLPVEETTEYKALMTKLSELESVLSGYENLHSEYNKLKERYLKKRERTNELEVRFHKMEQWCMDHGYKPDKGSSIHSGSTTGPN